MARLVMLIHEENGAFGASFPDLPGCTTVADSLDGLLAKVDEVVAFHLAGLDEDGIEIEPFRSLEELRAAPAFREDAADATLMLLEVDRPGRIVRVNITLDDTMLRRIDRAARNAGETRSGFLTSAARDRLAKTR